MFLLDQYGQLIRSVSGGATYYGVYGWRSNTGVHFVELRGRSTDYRVGIRTGITPYGSEPFLRDLPDDTSAKGKVRLGPGDV